MIYLLLLFLVVMYRYQIIEFLQLAMYRVEPQADPDRLELKDYAGLYVQPKKNHLRVVK